MNQEQTVDETAFRAGRIAALIGRKHCPYAPVERIKLFSWRRGWAEGEVERLLQAKAPPRP